MELIGKLLSGILVIKPALSKTGTFYELNSDLNEQQLSAQNLHRFFLWSKKFMDEYVKLPKISGYHLNLTAVAVMMTLTVSIIAFGFALVFDVIPLEMVL